MRKKHQKRPRRSSREQEAISEPAISDPMPAVMAVAEIPATAVNENLPPIIDRITAKRLMDEARGILAAFATGAVTIVDSPKGLDSQLHITASHRPTVREQAARRRAIETLSAGDGNGIEHFDGGFGMGELARAIREAPEPRRQRKERNLPTRRVYSMTPQLTADGLNAVRRQTPAAGQILVYLAMHPRATVPELVDQCDLRRKTVENLLSTLRREGLVEVEKSRGRG